MEEKLPDEPGTLEEIESISEEIGRDITRDVENECVSWHGSGYIGPRAACSCGRLAGFKNYYDKREVTLSGELVIGRAYYYCKSCGSGFSPLDAKLELDSLCTSIGVRTKLGRLASWLPFEEVSLELRELLGIYVSKNTVERVAEAMGEKVKEDRQAYEEMVLSGEVEPPVVGCKRLYVRIDGTCILARGGGGREVKTGVIYETCERDGRMLVSNAQYLATLERVEGFGDQVYSAAFARGVETVIRSIQSWQPEDEDAREVRRKNLAYFINNKQRMRYATFKARTYHIGSGLVESACKTVVGQRLKQSGMRWSEPGAEAVLSLRALLLTDRAADLRPYARAIA